MINLYVGKPVKTTKDKNHVWEIIRIADLTAEVICRPINSIDNEIRTFPISTIEDL